MIRAYTLCLIGWHCAPRKRVRKYDGGRCPLLCCYCRLIVGSWAPPAERSLPAFMCHCCGTVTVHPNDVAEGYCPVCHDFTGDSDLGPRHLARDCPQRRRA